MSGYNVDLSEHNLVNFFGIHGRISTCKAAKAFASAIV